jgi:hypothetical protein
MHAGCSSKTDLGGYESSRPRGSSGSAMGSLSLTMMLLCASTTSVELSIY